jgi:hypothetical protein
VGGSPKPLLRLLRSFRGTYSQSKREFLVDCIPFAVLVLVVPLLVVVAAIYSGATVPPSTPSDWGLLLVLVISVLAEFWMAPRMGRSIEFDGANVIVRSRSRLLLEKVAVAAITDVRVEESYVDCASPGRTLLLEASTKAHRLPMLESFSEELGSR